MATILLSIALIGFFIAGLMLRVIFKKDEEFRGTCATMNPMLVEKGVKCGCGKVAGTCETSDSQSSRKATLQPADFPTIKKPL